MSQKPTTTTSGTEIDFSDIPPLDENFFQNATVRIPKRKRLVSLRLDPDVVDWFKKRGKGYQTRINAVLKTYVQASRKSEHP